MKHFSALLLVILVGCATKSPTPPKPIQSTPDYMSLKYLDRELDRVRQGWRGKGVVLIGKLDLPQDAKVTSRTRIFPDGSFAAAVVPRNELIFYAHGYDPLKAKVYDAGSLSFSPASPENIRSVKCMISLADTHEDVKATVRLFIYNPACLGPGSGHTGGNIELVADSKTASDGHTVEFEGLSRSPYRMVFTAPGYIKQFVNIDPKEDGLIDLGDINLIKATTYEFTYRTRVRKYGDEWVTDSQPQKLTIVCDGISQLRFSDIRTGLGGKLDMRLLPHNNEVYASFYYAGAAFYTLDSSNIFDLGDFDSITVDENIEADNGVKIESGGLYYFRVKDFQDTDIELVFQPKRI